MARDGSDAAPGPDEVRRIAAIANPVLRNLEITQCYSRLAAAVAARSGEGANWCTYATWASRQAGPHDPRRGSARARSSAGSAPAAGSCTRSRRSGAGCSAAASSGPTRGSAGSTPSCTRPSTRSSWRARRSRAATSRCSRRSASSSRATSTSARGRPPGSASWAFLAGLRPGEPPDGQRYLRQAFAATTAGALEPTRRRAPSCSSSRTSRSASTSRRASSRRSARRSTPPYATNEDLGRRALVAVFPAAARRHAGCRPRRSGRRRVAAAVQRTSSRLAREVVTDSFMVLSLPGRVLALGTNLADAFPEPLREPADAELVELLGALRAGPARARRLRRPRLVGAPPADALHRATCSARSTWDAGPRTAAVHARAGDELRRGLVPDGEL